MATGPTSVVYNHDVVGLYERMNRFAEELARAASSSVSLTSSFDMARLSSYLDAIDRYHAWVTAQPQLDLPETSPREYALTPLAPLPTIENEDMSDVIRMLLLARDELINSQSARVGSGMIVHDTTRLTAVVAKARAFLKDYIEPTHPLDLPESSPAHPVSGPGRGGT